MKNKCPTCRYKELPQREEPCIEGFGVMLRTGKCPLWKSRGWFKRLLDWLVIKTFLTGREIRCKELRR